MFSVELNELCLYLTNRIKIDVCKTLKKLGQRHV